MLHCSNYNLFLLEKVDSEIATDGPKSVHKRFVIEVCCCVFVFPRFLFVFFFRGRGGGVL